MFCKLVLPSNEIHKLSALPASYEELCQIISNKLKDKIPHDFVLRYKDSDDELITLANSEDLQTAVLTTNSEGLKTLRIFILPAPENPDIQKLNQNLSLPRIPEALEKSRSSFGDAPNRSSPDKATENKEATSFTPFTRFDLNRLQKTHSLILDDVETINSTTPFSEKPDLTGNRRIFNFQRIDSLDFSTNLQESVAPNGILSDEQVKAIEAMLDTKLLDRIYTQIPDITKDLISRLNEECGFFNNPTYQSSVPAQGVARPTGLKRSSTQALPNVSEEKFPCNECNEEINGIKYLCLTCPNFLCCESCEPHVNHTHPLLKVRPSRNSPPYFAKNDSLTPLNSAPKINPISMPPYGVRSCGRYPGAKPALISMGTVSYPPRPSAQNENLNQSSSVQQQQTARPINQLRRGMSLGSLMNPAPSSSGSRVHRPLSDNETRYKAMIIKSTIYDIINVRPENLFNFQLTIRNIGDEKWAEKVKLICINGLYKGNEVDVKSIQPGEEQILNISLRAPAQIGKYLSQWKLHYQEDDGLRPFGKAICVDTDVSLRGKLYSEETVEASETEEREETRPISVIREEKDSRKRLSVIENETKNSDRNLIRGLLSNIIKC